MDGLEVAAALRDELPAVRVVMLTTFNRPGYLRRAMEAGAAGSCSRTPRRPSWRARSAPPRPGSGSSIPGSRPPRSARARTR